MERIVDIANSSLQTEAAIADAPDLEVSAVKEEAEESSSKELMLLVEDNQELRSFLRSIFASTYRVVKVRIYSITEQLSFVSCFNLKESI
jgi:hypothetical protein